MKKVNSIIKLSNNSSFVILIVGILKFRNIDCSTFRHSKFQPPPNLPPLCLLYQYYNILLLRISYFFIYLELHFRNKSY